MKESIQAFLTRGGTIQTVYYKTFEQVAPLPAGGGLKAVIQSQRQLSYQCKIAGIASGKARRLKAFKE